MNAGEPLSVKEAAELLGISASLTRRLIDNGQLTAYKYGRRKTVIYREDLERFRESSRAKPSSEAARWRA